MPDPKDPEQLAPIEIVKRYPATVAITYLLRLPVPPSSNNAYPTVQVQGRPRRVKSKAMRTFEKEFADWALEHHQNVVGARALARGLPKDHAIHIQTLFYFPKDQITCKTGKPKRMDVSNRLKGIHDAIAELVQIDDCYFISGDFARYPIENHQDAYVDVKLSICKIP